MPTFGVMLWQSEAHCPLWNESATFLLFCCVENSVDEKQNKTKKADVLKLLGKIGKDKIRLDKIRLCYCPVWFVFLTATLIEKVQDGLSIVLVVK